MTRYRFYVGNATQADIARVLVRHGVTGATVLISWGLWKSEWEEAVVVEIITDEALDANGLASDLANVHGDETVLYTREPVISHLVAGPLRGIA
jgi:hypothetical protein